MNNSFLPEEEKKQDYAERAGKLTTLIESAESILSSKEWSTLKETEFDGEIERLERVLLAEAKRPEVNTPELYRIQGRLEAMKRFDLSHMRDKWRTELDGINKLI